MNFLQPWMLAALPLALIPIIIHLINQRRYQSTQWAAMMFLLSANRMNRGYARIRQWLILALRALVIAALIFAIGRPIASGLLGGSITGAVTGRGPANTIVLLDRSPSMQASSDGTSSTKLQTGIEQIASALQTIGTERLVLIESNTAAPREIPSPADLLELPELGPSDASADVPAMLLAALDHINANQFGQTEIWICSDLRNHDWRAEDGRWSTLRDAFAEFGRRIRFRLLAFPGEEDGSSASGLANNLSVRVDEAKLEASESESAVLVSLTIQAATENSESASQTVPVTLNLGESRSVVEVEMQGGVGELKGHRVVLPRDQKRGYGSVTIPADRNLADNEFYFSFDAPPPRRTVIVSEDEEVARVLKLAAEITPEEGVTSVAEVVSPAAAAGVSWEDVSLVLWHAELPTSTTTTSGVTGMLQTLVDRGGRVIFFPPEPITKSPLSPTLRGGEGSGVRGLASLSDSTGHPTTAPENPSPPAPVPEAGRGEPDDGSIRVDIRPSTEGFFGSLRWDTWHDVEAGNAVSSWRGDADLLAATLAGTSLPVGTLRVKRYASVSGDATTLASLADGSPLLSRVATPRGGVYFCSTTPRAADSSLASDGVVLYVMLQRALQAGAESLGNTSRFDAGDASLNNAQSWQRLMGRDTALSSENAFIAGVFEQRDDGRLIVVNRSAGEDAGSRVSDPQIASLFGGLPFVRVDQQAGSSSSLVEEVWRAFLIIMLIAMISEACLCLPRVRTAEAQAQASRGASA